MDILYHILFKKARCVSYKGNISLYRILQIWFNIYKDMIIGRWFYENNSI